MAIPKPRFDGPIPGENYTSDTKNYPWHRPPDITDYDEAVEYVIEQISDKTRISMIYTMIENGISLVGIVSTINMLNIGNGKYPIDLSILISGPVARFIEIMAKKNGFEPKMGTPEDQIITTEMIKGLVGIPSDKDLDEIEEPVESSDTGRVSNENIPSGGLMGVGEENLSETASASEQTAMLGYSEEDEQEGEQ